MKKYTLKDEHEARFAEWRNKWIANAMSTEPMNDEDREITRRSVLGFYAAEKLQPPKHIVFVPSPFVLRFAGGFAAWIWYCRKHGLDPWRSAATRAATRDATYAATRDATDAATCAATCAATRDATRDATYAATDDATRDATRDATYAATYAATDDATDDATYAARSIDLSRWFYFGEDLKWATQAMLVCAQNSYNFWQGGNQWSAYDSFLSFFDRVVDLGLPQYENWRHWEQASLHSGPRIVHTDFAMVSDRPETLLVDNRNRPHCDTGPFCRWRDGSALYSIHGVRLPAWIIETPTEITPAKINAESNAEIRRVMMSKFGEAKYLEQSGAIEVSRDSRGILYRKDIPGDEALTMIRVENSTPEPTGERKTYWLRVPPGVKTATEGVAWSFGVEQHKYEPEVET
jgi:hypothetical protein